jgi:hypothetical protein
MKYKQHVNKLWVCKSEHKMKLKKRFGIGRADGNFVLWLFFVVGRGRWGNPRVIWAGGGGRMLMFTLISSLQSPFSIPESARREKRCAFCSGPCRLSGMPYFSPAFDTSVLVSVTCHAREAQATKWGAAAQSARNLIRLRQAKALFICLPKPEGVSRSDKPPQASAEK